MASNTYIDPLSPFYLHHSDSPGLVLVSQLLTGDNYGSWYRAMVIALSVKNKLGFVDGSIQKPDTSDSNLLNSWIRNNNIVISWILNSVSKEISASIIFAESALEIWLDLQDRFRQSNGPRIFQLRRELINLCQGQHSNHTDPTNAAESNGHHVTRISRNFQEIYSSDFPKKVIAEIIATYLLVFVTCGSAALSVRDEHKVSKLGASVAGGLIVTVMIYAVGHVSGAHMNPAVTLAFAAVRHFPWKQVPFYWAAQFTGATLSGFTLHVLLHPIKHVGTTSPSGTDLQALIMEMVVTFSMMFVTSAVATDTKAVGELAGIAVGSAVCITSILAGPISGGSMNPARTMGPAIASGYYKGFWIYIVGPVCGTLLGAWSYNFIRVSDQPVHALTPHSFSFKLRRMRSSEENTIGNHDNLNNII